jgi:hypothetical protein
MKIGFYSIPATGCNWAFWDGDILYRDPDYGKRKDEQKYLFEYRKSNSYSW